MNGRDGTRRVLVVDDDSTLAAPLADVFENRDSDVTVETAATAAAGFEWLDDDELDCIVSAHALPDRTGIEFLDAVRDTHPELPFVLVTDEEVASEAISAGVTDYLRKDEAIRQPDVLATRIEDAVETHRSRRELRTRHEELHLYEQAFQQMQEGACLYDTDGRFDIVNDYLTDFYGTTREALEGQPSQLVETIRAEGDGDPFQALLDGERAVVRGETTFDHPDRGEVFLNYRLVPLRIGDDIEGVVGVARDVTEQRMRERQLVQAREESQELINGMNDTAWVIGTDEQFLAVNDAAVEQMGYSRSELLSMAPHDIDAGLSDGEITSLIENMPEDGMQVFETAHRTKDGEVIPVEISSSLVTYQGETAILSVARDITDRKEYEGRLREQNQLLEQQRDELEVLNQVLRHDIRNDLQLVTAYADILHDHVDDEGLEHLATVQDRATHAVELTQTARDTATMMLTRDSENEPIDVRSVLEDEIEDLRKRYPDADVVVASEIPSAVVEANEMIASVFRNLLTNAVQHNDEDVPEIVVSTTREGDELVVRIADNGPGISDAQKDAIFGRGEKGLDSRGTGLGLYLVETLVEQYGGDVRVEDNDPEGAVFVVELPTVE
ncbi:hybrid sensor histidine kinase/response regulator [Haloplanus aerogenes]|uniref:histidine kinase n=1 Tax=Haloplanus aerogenes TaxID=660522 RepID=A0A3M0DWR5_9EURY|nr:PAS domain S-box protein [Haloplanus aerogenes]AZH25633.1 PAS domain S-box protein [Haloplanus aerogenes]RMB25357.1 PAS domain S-box-containing protein [Haloplanus aerogenes]